MSMFTGAYQFWLPASVLGLKVPQPSAEPMQTDGPEEHPSTPQHAECNDRLAPEDIAHNEMILARLRQTLQAFEATGLFTTTQNGSATHQRRTGPRGGIHASAPSNWTPQTQHRTLKGMLQLPSQKQLTAQTMLWRNRLAQQVGRHHNLLSAICALLQTFCMLLLMIHSAMHAPPTRLPPCQRCAAGASSPQGMQVQRRLLQRRVTHPKLMRKGKKMRWTMMGVALERGTQELKKQPPQSGASLVCSLGLPRDLCFESLNSCCTMVLEIL